MIVTPADCEPNADFRVCRIADFQSAGARRKWDVEHIRCTPAQRRPRTQNAWDTAGRNACATRDRFQSAISF
jgi:hypothetical protein